MKRKNLFAALAVFSLLNATAPARADDAAAELKALCAKISSSDEVACKVKKFDMDQAVKMLDDEGYKIVKKSDIKAVIKSSGRTFVLYRFDDGDYQMYYGITGVDISPRDINEWNRDKRLSRAYLDKDDDPVLEADFDMTEGATKEQFLHFVKLFIDTSAPAFRLFLLEK